MMSAKTSTSTHFRRTATRACASGLAHCFNTAGDERHVSRRYRGKPSDIVLLTASTAAVRPKAVPVLQPQCAGGPPAWNGRCRDLQSLKHHD